MPNRVLYIFILLFCLGWGAGALEAGAPDPFGLQLPEKAVSDRVASRVRNVQPGARVVLAELEGPGCIQHILFPINYPEAPPNSPHFTGSGSPQQTRKMIIRIYFDGAETPHVEAPVGDFFGVMHGLDFYPINTEFLSVQQQNAYNCYFKMPFAKSARIEVENGPNNVPVTFHIQVDWHRYPRQEMKETRRFCAQWRREAPTTRWGRDYLMLDADGPGNLIGFVYGVRLIDNEDRWSHGGAENIYIDGHGEDPAYIRGTGGEDTFGTTYGGVIHPPETHLFAGLPFFIYEDVGEARGAQRLVGYRFFSKDTIEFRESIHMRFGCMQNDICSTVYWYQTGVPRRFVNMPDWERMLPRMPRNAKLPYGEVDLPLPDSGSWLISPPLENNEAIQHALGKGGAAPKVPPRNEWKLLQAHHGFADVNHLYRPHRRGPALPYVDKAAEAVATIEAPANMKARLRLAWDEHLVLRINNDAPIDMGNHAAFRSREIEVSLKKGKNNISLTLSNTMGTNWSGWAFNFMLTTPDGTRLLPRAEEAAE